MHGDTKTNITLVNAGNHKIISERNLQDIHKGQRQKMLDMREKICK